jgi:hypothetical protein
MRSTKLDTPAAAVLDAPDDDEDDKDEDDSDGSFVCCRRSWFSAKLVS